MVQQLRMHRLLF